MLHHQSLLSPAHRLSGRRHLGAAAAAYLHLTHLTCTACITCTPPLTIVTALPHTSDHWPYLLILTFTDRAYLPPLFDLQQPTFADSDLGVVRQACAGACWRGERAVMLATISTQCSGGPCLQLHLQATYKTRRDARTNRQTAICCTLHGRSFPSLPLTATFGRHINKRHKNLPTTPTCWLLGGACR